jgi:hypothetical protein
LKLSNKRIAFPKIKHSRNVHTAYFDINSTIQSAAPIPRFRNVQYAAITLTYSQFLGMRHPIFLAGMNVAAGPELAAAVSNAGGCGVIGGVGAPAELPGTLFNELFDL